MQTQPLPFYLKLSEAYGAEVGVGGNVDWRKASLLLRQVCRHMIYKVYLTNIIFVQKLVKRS